MPQRSGTPNTNSVARHDPAGRVGENQLPSEWSGHALRLIRTAIATSTRRSYQSSFNAYVEWCEAHGYDGSAARITPVSAGNWLADRASTMKFRSGTIKACRSALSTLWTESMTEGPNPLESRNIDRLITGITAMLRERDAESSASEKGWDLTPAILREMLPAAKKQWEEEGLDSTVIPRARMCWAAACLGVFGLLRPGEFIDVAQGPERLLAASAITFFASPGSERPQGLLPRGTNVDDYRIPDRFTIRLGITKADQLGKNPDHVIAAPMGVQALWRWMHIRRDAYPEGAVVPNFVFVWPRSSHLHGASKFQLRLPALNYTLSTWAPRPAGCQVRFMGKSFRRGGASAMTASGAPIPDIMAAGRWKSSAMVGVYSNAESKRDRAIAMSRAMDPTANSDC